MPKRALAVAAASIVALAILASCGDTEEVLPETPNSTVSPSTIGPTASPSPATSLSPTTAAPTAVDAIQKCPPVPVEPRTLAPSSDGRDVTYTDPSGRFTVSLIAAWTPCHDGDPAQPGGGVQFLGDDGLPHARIYLYPNKDGLDLQEWVTKNDPIFLGEGRMTQSTLVGGAPALLNLTDAEGLPRAEAYVDLSGEIAFISALKIDEFELINSGIKLGAQ